VSRILPEPLISPVHLNLPFPNGFPCFWEDLGLVAVTAPRGRGGNGVHQKSEFFSNVSCPLRRLRISLYNIPERRPIYIFCLQPAHAERERETILAIWKILTRSAFSLHYPIVKRLSPECFFFRVTRDALHSYIAESPRHYCAQGLRPACKQATSEQAALTPDLCQHVCLCCAERGEVSQSSRHWHVCWRAA
jgi:hypothetical protein